MSLLCLLLGTAALAQPAFRIADVNPADGEESGALFFAQTFATLDGQTFFTADDGVHGLELWKTGGSAAGMVLVADVCPGVCSGWPRALTPWGGNLYFAALDGTHGWELWKTDGTAAGTVLVKDVRPGLADGYVGGRLLGAGSFLYFMADDGAAGPELWQTDGTAAGTQLVADIRPGAAGSDPGLRAAGGGRLLLSADDGVHGYEPWLSDGTAAGTALLADVNPGASPSCGFSEFSYPGKEWLAAPWGGFLFVAHDADHGDELWVTDGTAAGTSMLLDAYPGAIGALPHELTPSGGTVYFSAADPDHSYEIWRTDGTPGGTTRVTDVNPGTGNAGPAELTPLGSRILFRAYEADHGYELWATDGTAAGTALVKDLLPGPASGFNLGRPHAFTDLDGQLVFLANDGSYGFRVWRSDGTTAGTVPVADLGGVTFPVSVFYAGSWASAGGRLFFLGYILPQGLELWSTDGTAAGTGLVKEMNVQTSSIALFWDGDLDGVWGSLGSRLLFSAYDGSIGREPRVSDGTAAGTAPLGDLTPGPESSYPTDLTPVGNLSFFSTQTGLWKTDGTAAGTVPLSASGGTGIAYGNLFLFAGTDANGTELWKSDGTAAGTGLVRNIHLGTDQSGNPSDLTLVNGIVYFRADDGAIGEELWRSDGSYAGTYRVKDVRPVGASSSPARLRNLNGTLLFSAATDGEGRELWKSNGTEAGTVLVKDVRPGTASSIFASDDRAAPVSAVAGPFYYFVADDGTSGEELWRSDGTAPGTVLVKDVFPGARGSEPRSLTAAGARLFFVADDGAHGRELWVTDGSAAGTHLVKDLVAGTGSPVPRHLTSVDGTLLFTAWDEDHGVEPWRSDGTAAGTVLVQDVAPGPLSSSPLAFTVAGPWVYFAADDGSDGDGGFEPWVLPRAALGAGLDFYTLEPCRAVDTRTAGGALSSGLPRTIAVAGSCGIPADAVALSVNLTVVSPTATGNVVAHAAGAPPQATSNVSFAAGQTRANNAILALGPGGLEALATLAGGGQVDLLVDVNGFFK
jgi:ELWxxDGT repeat protein